MHVRTLSFSLIVALAACTQQAPEPVEEPAPAETEKADAAAEEAPALKRTPSVEGTKVFIKSPADGATVKSPVTIEFGVEGMSVVKAGDETPGTGHHHLIIDAELPPFDAPIPANDNYIHYGDASLSTTRELTPGEHKLQILFGDYRHVPHDPPVYSEVITITVE